VLSVVIPLLSPLPAVACPDGGVELPPARWASSARLVELDGGVTESGGPGGWLPELRFEAEACELANLREQNRVLSATPPLFSPATWAAIGMAAAIALFLGGFGGWELSRLFGGR
jgi:hypothetical protein